MDQTLHLTTKRDSSMQWKYYLHQAQKNLAININLELQCNVLSRSGQSPDPNPILKLW